MYETKLEEARGCAQRAADKFTMPQTVYKNSESCGWWHTNAFANLLHKAEVNVTYLPENYFRQELAFPTTYHFYKVSVGDRKVCLQAGMNNYVAKPISPDALFAVIKAKLSQEAAIA